MKVKVLLEPPLVPAPRPKPRRKHRGIAAARMLLLVVGLAALGYCAYIYLDAKVYDAYQNWAFDQRAQGLSPSVHDFVFKGAFVRALFGRETEVTRPVEPRPDQQAQAEPQPKPKRLPPDTMIGRIVIPRLGVRAVVKEGVDSTTLRRGVGHVPGTALPGDLGNVALAGHRDTFFRSLKDVKRDDVIRLETLEGDYEYVVQSTKIVYPKDVNVIAPTKDAELTLVTCYPFYYVGSAPQRFIVKARRATNGSERAALTERSPRLEGQVRPARQVPSAGKRYRADI